MDDELPHPREEDVWIVRVERDVRRAGRIVDEEHTLPRRPAVLGPIDAALLLRPVARA